MLNVIWWKFGTFPNFWPQKRLWTLGIHFISFSFIFSSSHISGENKKAPQKVWNGATVVGRATRCASSMKGWGGLLPHWNLSLLFYSSKDFLFKIGVWLPHIHSRQLIQNITLSYVIYYFTPKWLFKYVSAEILPNKRSLPPLGLEPMTNIISPGYYLLYRIYTSMNYIKNFA